MRSIGSMIMVAMALAGCANPMAKSWGSNVTVAPDGTGRWTRGSIVQAQGSQIIRSGDEVCVNPAKDAEGKIVSWEKCAPQPHPNGTTAGLDNSPGAKAGVIAGQLGEAVIIGGSGVAAAELIRKGMVGAAKAHKPDSTNVTQNPQQTTGAVTQTANPVQTQTANPVQTQTANPVQTQTANPVQTQTNNNGGANPQ